jgi:V8-like Glu-specific endopeptidase
LSADQSYPYTTVGRLYFTKSGSDYYCSAAVIGKRVLVTAGHCIHNGNGAQSGFFDNWKFVPALRDGSAPFKTWNWSYVTVTNTWYTSGGSIPNAADYGMIEVQDNGTRVGDMTGSLGFQTLSLMPNHAHILGYSSNFDSGQKMHQVTAQSAATASPNNVEYGSDMLDGSSGSAMVQNFGSASSGQTGGKNPGFNRLIGVIAWGYTTAGSMAEGGSVPDNRFSDLFNTVCNHKSGNC